MSPLLRHTPRTRDDALERRRRMATTATVGGLAAVGAITGGLAVSAAQGDGPTPGATLAASGAQPADPSQEGGVPQDANGLPRLQAPANQPSMNPGRGGPGGLGAVTGGSGHG